MARIRTDLQAALPVDAVYIAAHGAMTTTANDDPDGDQFKMVREIVGPDVPIIATLDLHANVSQRMVDNADTLEDNTACELICSGVGAKNNFSLCAKPIAPVKKSLSITLAKSCRS